jgi:hypothetical protein
MQWQGAEMAGISGEEVQFGNLDRFQGSGFSARGAMGAAQGDLAAAEIVEQGPGALHLCKVKVCSRYFLQCF